jgi:hypothetical protein
MCSAKLVSKLTLVLGLVILFLNLSGCCPCFKNHDKASASNATICQRNLKNIDIAKEQWALDNKKSADMVPTWNDLLGATTPSAPYLSGMPKCPDGGTYTLNAVSKNPTCSIPGHTLE